MLVAARWCVRGVVVGEPRLGGCLACTIDTRWCMFSALCSRCWTARSDTKGSCVTRTAASVAAAGRESSKSQLIEEYMNMAKKKAAKKKTTKKKAAKKKTSKKK